MTSENDYIISKTHLKDIKKAVNDPMIKYISKKYLLEQFIQEHKSKFPMIDRNPLLDEARNLLHSLELKKESPISLSVKRSLFSKNPKSSNDLKTSNSKLVESDNIDNTDKSISTPKK